MSAWLFDRKIAPPSLVLRLFLMTTLFNVRSPWTIIAPPWGSKPLVKIRLLIVRSPVVQRTSNMLCVSAPLIVRPLPLMVIALAICGSSALSVMSAVILIVSASLLPFAVLMAVTSAAWLAAVNVAARAGATDSSRKTSAASINLNANVEWK